MFCRRYALRATVLAASAVLLAGCGAASVATPSGDGQITIVASTDVWGDIAATIGGARVQVDSLISRPAQDPHSFEPGPRAQLAVDGAQLIIENGGGYDDFMDQMIASSGKQAHVVTAVTASGVTAPKPGELNEHVWYDIPGVAAVAHEIASALGAIDPGGTADFQRHLQDFLDQLSGLQRDVAQIRAAHAGEHVAVTEPVPLYLLQAAGLVNVTPAEFTEATEEGNDVPARILVQMLDLLSGTGAGAPVAVLVYNSQTLSAQVDQLVTAARHHGIPTVPVTETLPAGEHYASWMRANISALSEALGR